MTAAKKTHPLSASLRDRIFNSVIGWQTECVLKDAANELDRLHDLINTPLYDDFTEAVKSEAIHQINRWGTAHDRGKQPQDWFWLIGYLAGKALRAHIDGDTQKAKHHTISSASALLNWHSAISGADSRMQPGHSDLERDLEEKFGGVSDGTSDG